MKDIAEGEKWSKNLIVFGLEEEDEGDARASASELFVVLGERPRPEEVSRLGTQSSVANVQLSSNSGLGQQRQGF